MDLQQKKMKENIVSYVNKLSVGFFFGGGVNKTRDPVHS